MPKQKLKTGESSKRVQGRPLSQQEIQMIIKSYERLKEQKITRIRERLHEYLGVSVRKIAELWREYKNTTQIPSPKNRVAWNKGKKIQKKTKKDKNVTTPIDNSQLLLMED